MTVFINDGGRRKVVASGYGRVSKNIGSWLKQLGVTVIYIDEDLKGYKDVDICLFICPPYGATTPYEGKKNYIFTMHEQATLQLGKENWPEILNKLDLLITPSAWNRQIFKDLGITTPIEVCPLGSDPDIFYPFKNKFKMISVFSGLGSGSSRENWEDTIRAYFRAFANGKDLDKVELVFKTWQWKKENWENIFNKIRKEEGIHHDLCPQITIIDEELSDEALRDLYHQSTVAIKNANRESWGLGANEAILCGVQMIASRVQPLPVFMPLNTHWVDLGGIDELSFFMKLEYNKFNNNLKLLRQFTWENSAKRLKQILEAHVKVN
jgi:glycosyltransferase involved in cell wall biosynthesis